MHSQFDVAVSSDGTARKPDDWRAVARALRSPRGAGYGRLLRAAQGVVDDLAITLFPADCRLCHGPLLRIEDSAVCAACLARILPQSILLCACCGEALSPESARAIGLFSSAEASLCPACRMAPPEFERAVAFGVYEDELREAIHLLKYDRVRTLARPLGAMLAGAALTLEGPAARELIVVPVPLFRPKQRERGYDQSALLAEAMVRHLRRLRPEWRLRLERGALRRVRDTRSQFGLMPQERRANLRGAFRVPDAAAVAGRELLLVDDILTTGTTARECARVLRRAGAAKVWVATVARAQRHDVATAWDAPRPKDLILN